MHETPTSWLQISAEVAQNDLEYAEAALLASGALSITLSDAANQPLLEPKPGETPTWDTCIITALYDQPELQTNILIQLQTSLRPFTLGVMKSELLEDKNWVRAWMDNYSAMAFGNHIPHKQQLWIYPSHLEPPETQAYVVRLDPGMAFGTGTHATTALCLDWIAENEQTDKIIVDYGCGSGLLGIAAVIKGAQHCYAFDIDPQALEASHNNAKKNGITAKVRLSATSPAIEADIVYANILANTLIALYNDITTHCKTGGDIVLSGILEEQMDDILHCYTPAFEFSQPRLKDGWVCMHAKKV